MRIISRSAPLLATLLGAILALAGCGSGPSEINSAAIVGQRAVSVDDVQREISWLLQNVPQARKLARERKLPVISQAVLQQHVTHELLAVAKKRDGVRASEADVDALIESWGGAEAAPTNLGVLPGRLQELAEDRVLLRELGEKYAATLTVDVVGTVVVGESAEATSEEKALELGRKIAADPERAAQIAAESGGQVLDQPLALKEMLASNTAALAGTALFGAKPGTVVVIQPSPEQGAAWLVALIKDRKISTGGGQDEAPQADPQVLESVGMQQLALIADEIGVRISPRYGVWDQAGMKVAESGDHLTGHLIPVRSTRP